MNKKYYIILGTLFLFSSCSDEGVNPIYGCTDENAINYNSNANINNENCVCTPEIENPLHCDDENIVFDTNGDGCICCYGDAYYGLDDEENISFMGYMCGDDIFFLNTECSKYTYNNDIYNIFAQNGCLVCHTGESSGGLDLSTYDGIIDGGYNGSILIGCNPSESILITAFNPGGLMYENVCNCNLPDQSIIETWITQGALE